MAEGIYNDPEQNAPQEQAKPAQDKSKVPAYPYLMSGQQGWPSLEQNAPTSPGIAAPPQSGTGIQYPAAGDQGGQAQPASPAPSYQDFERDYHAPDRDQVLADMQAQNAQRFSGVKAWQEPGMYEDQQRTTRSSDYHTMPNNIPDTGGGMNGKPYSPGDVKQLPGTPGSSGTSGAAGGKAGSPEWIQSQLQAVQSTDNPEYWAGVMSKDPKVAAGDPSAIAYWVDRIRRGNGSALVKSGQLSLYGGDTPGNSTSGSGNGGFPGSGTNPYGMGGDRSNGLWDTLMKRANQSLDVNPKDPIIARQTNSFRAEQERGTRNQLSQLAEAGGPQANLNQERRMGNEHAAQATGNLESTLMQHELDSRRQEISQALAQQGSMLSDEQRLGLQRELGLLDAQMRQQQITNQNNQFLDQFGLNVTDRSNYWDSLRAGLLSG